MSIFSMLVYCLRLPAKDLPHSVVPGILLIIAPIKQHLIEFRLRVMIQ